MTTLRPFSPATGTEAEWNAAYARLEDYLRALHVASKAYQGQIVLKLLESAAERHAKDPSRNPTELVMEEADVALKQWFARIFPDEKRAIVTGYVVLMATGALERWPEEFLQDRVSSEFKHAIREYDVRSGPGLRISSMVPRPIDVSPLVHGVLVDSEEDQGNQILFIALITIVLLVALFLVVRQWG